MWLTKIREMISGKMRQNGAEHGYEIVGVFRYAEFVALEIRRVVTHITCPQSFDEPKEHSVENHLV